MSPISHAHSGKRTHCGGPSIGVKFFFCKHHTKISDVILQDVLYLGSVKVWVIALKVLGRERKREKRKRERGGWRWH